MTEKEMELLVRADNSMIWLLTPEELETFAEFDRIEKESQRTKAELFEKVKGRDLTGRRDNASTEETELLDKLSPETHEFAQFAYSEELEQFAALSMAESQAMLGKNELMKIAAERKGPPRRGSPRGGPPRQGTPCEGSPRRGPPA